MAGGYNTVVAGTTITAATHNEYVRDQVVSQFATTAARTSAVASPVEGMASTIAGDDRFEVYDGSAYQRVAHYASAGRTGGTWTRATNQSINNVTVTTVTFTTEGFDSDGFLTPTSGTVTIPTGLGGIYAWEFTGTWSSTPTTYQQANQAAHGASGIAVMAAGDTFVIQDYQASGGALNLNPAKLNFYRLAI
jgi:hypothetical protein